MRIIICHFLETWKAQSKEKRVISIVYDNFFTWFIIHTEIYYNSVNFWYKWIFLSGLIITLIVYDIIYYYVSIWIRKCCKSLVKLQIYSFNIENAVMWWFFGFVSILLTDFSVRKCMISMIFFKNILRYIKLYKFSVSMIFL